MNKDSMSPSNRRYESRNKRIGSPESSSHYQQHRGRDIIIDSRIHQPS